MARTRNHGTAPRPGSAGAFTPDALSVSARHLEVGNEFVASFGVTGYPQEVYPGWLAPVLTYPARLDVSVHVQPVDPATAASGLRKQRAKLESSRRHNARHDRLDDPDLDAAAEDAADLSRSIARGDGKLFKFGLYLTVHAPDETSLAEEVSALRSLCASLLLDAKPATYRALQGWVSTLPLGLDPLGLTRTFDTAAVSVAYPFTSPDLPPADPAISAPSGVLYGYNVGSSGLVHWDSSPATTTTPSSSAAAARVSRTSSSSRPCAASTADSATPRTGGPHTGYKRSSSTPRTSTRGWPPRSAAPTSTSARAGSG